MILHPQFSIVHLTSGIVHPRSIIVLHRQSGTVHPQASCYCGPVLCVMHDCSQVKHLRGNGYSRPSATGTRVWARRQITAVPSCLCTSYEAAVKPVLMNGAQAGHVFDLNLDDLSWEQVQVLWLLRRCRDPRRGVSSIRMWLSGVQVQWLWS